MLSRELILGYALKFVAVMFATGQISWFSEAALHPKSFPLHLFHHVLTLP